MLYGKGCVLGFSLCWAEPLAMRNTLLPVFIVQGVVTYKV